MSRYNGFIARDEFELAKQLFQNAGFDLNAIRLTGSDIRLEQPLTANQNMYTFPVLVNIQNQGAPFATEIRLQQQDSICVTQLGFFLAKADTSSTSDAAYILQTYPNPAIFTNATQMKTIYNNGRINLTIANDVWVKNWGLMRHYKAPQTQQTTAPGSGSPVDELDGVDDGFYPVAPFVILTGAQDIQLNIMFNIASPTAVDANSRLVIVMRGFNAQSTTPIK